MNKGIDIIKQVKEAKFEIKFAKGEVDGVIGGPGGLAPTFKVNQIVRKLEQKLNQLVINLNQNLIQVFLKEKLNQWDELDEDAEYQGKKVKLNNPVRGGNKKFYVYVKNDKGNIIKVSFGDSTGLSIKRDDPERRKAFRARHNCDQKKDKTTPGYWSCKFWEKGKSVTDLMKG